MDTLFKLTLDDGTTITGAIQGSGGRISYTEHVERSIRQAKRGRPTGIYEPSPGHALVDDGATQMHVDLRRVVGVSK
jgi:hypothetical protein